MRTIIINNQRISTVLLHMLSISLLGAWSIAPAAHEYTISVDKNLQNMTVEARFDRPISYISARSRNAARYLDSASDCDANTRLAARGRKLNLPTAGIRCLSYTVSLAAADRDEAKILFSPSLWMWRPRLQRADEILATFDLPGGSSVFVPWQMIGNDSRRYRLRASPESGSAIAVFGDFEERTESVAGAHLRIVMLGKPGDGKLDNHIDWIRSTAMNIEQTYGRFPNPGATIILNPVNRWGWGGNRAVSFGRVIRDGGETVELMINPDRPIAEFYKAWTPTHEFSHLMLPYVDGDQRWISEGFAQYYQNILLARAGQHSALEAWQKIYSGLDRGRDSAPGASPNAAARGRLRNTRMKVYWSGASLALMADVELRRRSGGEESLDTVLDDLQRCCLPSTRTWSGVELFQQLDTFLDEPLFMALYRKYADADDFPDARPVLKRLGVMRRGAGVLLDDDAELAAIRAAITD